MLFFAALTTLVSAPAATAAAPDQQGSPTVGTWNFTVIEYRQIPPTVRHTTFVFKSNGALTLISGSGEPGSGTWAGHGTIISFQFKHILPNPPGGYVMGEETGTVTCNQLNASGSSTTYNDSGQSTATYKVVFTGSKQK